MVLATCFSVLINGPETALPTGLIQTSDMKPLLINPQSSQEGQDLPRFIIENSATLKTNLIAEGAILFRGFDVAAAGDFEKVSASGTENLAEYTGGGSPRKRVEGKVYTSTEYPANQAIPLHCEESYFPEVPKDIWFFCERPAEELGQTPLGCMRFFLEVLDDEIRDAVIEKGLVYIYNLHGGGGFGRGWKEAFLTEDREVVTQWLEENKAEYTWKNDGSLAMRLAGKALRTHSTTGDSVWGNQIVNWHIDALPGKMAQMMRKLYSSEGDMPKHVMFGDGSPIPRETVERLLEQLRGIESCFDWQAGDVLWCDNERIAHGRRPFKGDRRILVSLG